MSEPHCTIRAVAYHRKSNEDDGGSVEEQRQWAQSVCPAKGIEIVREFTDQSVSGHDTDKRLGFKAMLKFCQEEQRKGHPVDAVVCWHSNRFSRADSNETGFYVWSFRQAGVNRIFTTGGWVDFRETNDRVLFNLTQDVSNHAYSKDLAAAVTRGKAKRAEEGKWNGGPAPYGYRVVNRRLVLDPAAAAIVRWLFETYALKDWSLYGLAADLNRRGVPSPTGKAYWGAKAIAVILHNPAYLGDLHYGRRAGGKFFCACNLEVKKRTEHPGKLRPKDPKDVFVKEGNHEAIVPRALWERVQKRLAERRRRTTPLAGGGDFLLTGLLHCGNCGSAHSPRHQRQKDGTRVKVYRCNGYCEHGPLHPCASNLIHEDVLLAALIAKVKEIYLDPDRLARLREVIRRQDQEDTHEDTARAGQLAERLAELSRKIERGTEVLMDELDKRLVEGHRRHLQGLHDQKDRVQAELDALAMPQAKEDLEEGVNAALAELEHFLEVVREGEPALVRVALADLISKVELFFQIRPRGKKQKTGDFVKALVYVRADFGLANLGTTERLCVEQTRVDPRSRPSYKE
jgi:site-specific DNA recombinase